MIPSVGEKGVAVDDAGAISGEVGLRWGTRPG